MDTPQANGRGSWWMLVAFAVPFLSMPLIAAGIGLIREHVATRSQLDLLEHVPFMTNGWDWQTAETVGARDHLVIARLDTQGSTVFRTRPVRFDGGALGQTLDAVDARFPPWQARDEVRAALGGKRALGRYRKMDESALVLALAQPVPDGGVLYVMTGSDASALGGVNRAGDLGRFMVFMVFMAVLAVRNRRRRPDGATT